MQNGAGSEVDADTLDGSGRFYLYRCQRPSSVTVKRRKSWLLAASALASSLLGVSEPALALNECGPLDTSGSATCTPAGTPPNPGNPYPNGITYAQTVPGNLTVNLQQGVNVNLISNPDAPSLGTAVSVSNFISGDAIVHDLGATITSTVNHGGAGNSGIAIRADNGSAIVTASGTITLGSSDGEEGIVAAAGGATASVTYTGPSSGSGIIAGGIESSGIQAFNFGSGNAKIEASGNVEVSGPSVYGLIAHAVAGDASVTYHSGTINVSGSNSRGILAWVDGNGSAMAKTDAGTFINVNGAGPGVYVYSGTATAASGQKVTADVASTITGTGVGTGVVVGIKAFSGADAPIFVNYTGPGITIAGGSGGGSAGIAGLSGSGSVNVTSTGPITTNGPGAFGILADSGSIAARTTITTAPGAEPIVVTPSVSGAPGGPIVVTTSGPGSITTQGIESHGIWATSTTGTVQVSTTTVSTTGEFSAGINAAGGGGTMVNVASGGSVMGGWQADLTSFGPTYGLPAAGVILGGGTATLTNSGSIGALSDRAVASSPLFPSSNNTSIINNGTITGFVQLVGGNNSITNNGLFDLRHFADTTGGGRDTLRVAIADLGAGQNNSFTNNGTLALPAVTGATKLDSTGQYLPLGNPNNAMALGGPLQGHLIGVQTFTNSGTIDLQSNPVAGDVLVITGGLQAGVAPTHPIAGAGGPGTFISNGGMLKLDTVLNEGGAATRSDTLVVDGTSVGPLGATNMSIRNAGGAGAETVGDGILVVQVLDPSRSPDSVFKLASAVEVRGGAFDYDLFHGGVGGSNPNNWFLRSSFVVPEQPGPQPPEPSVPLVPIGPSLPTNPPVTGPLPPGVFPIIGPEIATYGVVQPIARQLGMTTLGTLQDRIGDTSLAAITGTPCQADGDTRDGIWRKAPVKVPTDCLNTGSGPSAWGRVLGQQIDNHYGAFADPRASGQLLGFQTGIDLWRGEWIPGHRDAAGIYVGYANANVDVNGLVTNAAATGYVLSKTGNLNLDAWSGGAYWTHYGPSDWYLDAVAQATHYQGAASTQFANLSTSGFGFLTSLETGYPIRLPMFGPGFVLEPQAQIVWQRVSFDDANDGLGEVALGTTSGASGRIGLRGRWTIVSDGGQVWQP